MRSRIAGLPLSHKISGIFILASLLTFVVDIALLLSINRMSIDMEQTYRENSHLNEMLEALDGVQRTMTEYLNSKSTDSLSDYYMSEQRYSELAQELDVKVSDRAYDRMERNIHYMSEDYQAMVSRTIEAKRGRNVERYRVYFEDATRKYEYIKAYIRSLNEEQFVNNSEKYTKLVRRFRKFEIFAVAVMFAALFGSVFVIIGITRSLIQPLGALAESAAEVANGKLDAELKDLIKIRTLAGTNSIPAFDVFDYGGLDFVFGSETKDARHWDEHLLKVMTENETYLKPIFDIENK